MKPLFNTLSLMVTYQCNVACKHCGPYCAPGEHDWATLDELKDLARQAGELGVYNAVLTGGEPTLMKDELITFLRYVKKETKLRSLRMVTNGKWATTYDVAYAKLKEWRDAGLDELNISCGEFHQEWIPIESVANAYLAACALNYDTVLIAGEFIRAEYGKYSPRDFEKAIGRRLENIKTRSAFTEKVRGMSCGAAIPYGRGKKYITDEMVIKTPGEELRGICQDVNSVITIHPNGNVTACCGVMVREDTYLTIGNWREKALKEIVESSNQDIILNWIKYLGLNDMRDFLLKKDPSLSFTKDYSSICDLCAQIMYNKRCNELLYEHAQEREDAIITNKLAQDATVYATDFKY